MEKSVYNNLSVINLNSQSSGKLPYINANEFNRKEQRSTFRGRLNRFGSNNNHIRDNMKNVVFNRTRRIK